MENNQNSVMKVLLKILAIVGVAVSIAVVATVLYKKFVQKKSLDEATDDVIDDIADFCEEIEEAEDIEEIHETMLDDSQDPLQIQIIRCLLDGGDPGDLLSKNHLMPSIAADTINEAFFDEIGDTVIECEDDRLELVEDYIDDLRRMIGG